MAQPPELEFGHCGASGGSTPTSFAVATIFYLLDTFDFLSLPVEDLTFCTGVEIARVFLMPCCCALGEKVGELPAGREKDALLDVFKLPAKRILF